MYTHYDKKSDDVANHTKDMDSHRCLWVVQSCMGPCHLFTVELLIPVVRRLISAHPGLNFNPDFFFFSSTALLRVVFSILCRASNRQKVNKRNNTEFASFKAFIYKIKVCTYLNFEQPSQDM